MESQFVTFDQILGQSVAIDALATAFRQDRLPHALIFAGPMGVGKETTACALAALFLCEKPGQLAACGKCASCLSFAAGTHPDYHPIYRELIRLEKSDAKARDLSADVIRDHLIARAANKSVVGIGKVFVVRDAEMMNTTAQNILLKTLEEPAGRTLIILLTDQLESLLPTIRSRCRVIRFAPLDRKIVQQELRKRNIDHGLAASAAGFAEGSLGLAIDWINLGVIDRAAELVKLLGQVLGGQSAMILQPWLKSAADAYAEKRIEVDDKTSKDQASREGMILYLKLASQYFRS
ncbi:MAG TPA: DNA polymerase III subunit delta', partial [Tepidisphaeraceae bacterium]|nr:DNA polymerase III subunit delta' [Tepidisphaeraceae bacterium]